MRILQDLNKYGIKRSKNMNKLLKRFLHTWFGCPKEKCEKIGALSVRCECGRFISLSDYY